MRITPVNFCGVKPQKTQIESIVSRIIKECEKKGCSTELSAEQSRKLENLVSEDIKDTIQLSRMKQRNSEYAMSKRIVD